ncbi:chemotaxis protein [Vibrio splendidus]|uniref:Chemotaxis protein n=1 Tax=Vibrio splendidus TaxID=29497 RepID=A0AB35MXD4_VIBSP|nr:chemotaxis protein [Vibrio splendidus]MDP2501063.1 chemotaxis protein [Vibrio splendidus]PMM68738.1 chemotaxis protein [Vibrio splendidus]
MLQFILNLFSEPVTAVIIGSTIVCFIFFLYREWKTNSDEKIRLSALASLTDRFGDGQLPIGKLTKDELVWVTDHLVYDAKGELLLVESKQGKWLSKSPVTQMLPSFDASRYKLVPALLTSLGITGTFLGITLGLSEFSMTGESQALLKSAALLLEGMKTAFYTSLVGLSLSAVFMAVMKASSSTIAKKQSDFIAAIASQYLEASPIMYLKNISNENQQEVIDAQLNSALVMEKLGGSMDSVVTQLFALGQSFNGEIIANTISAAVTESIEKQMSPALEGIKNELSLLKDIKEQNQKELMELMIGEMKTQLIEPVVAELDKTASAVEKNNEVSELLNRNVEQVMTRTAETVETIDKFQQETMLKLQGFAESLKEILSSFKDDTQGAMGAIANEVQLMLNSATEGMDKQRVAFEHSSETAASAFEGIKDSMDKALSERQSAEQALFNNVESRIASLLKESQDIFDNQTKVLETVGEEASGLMSSAKDELISGLGDIDKKVISMSQTVQTELEAFREQYQQNLTSYFTQQNTLLEDSLGKQRDGLNGVVDNFRKVFESEYQTRHNLLQELTAQHTELQKSAKTIEQVAKAIGLNEASKMAELQDAARTMGREIGQLKLEYSKAAATFNDVTENLPKAMDEYFTRANQSFESFFGDFDTAASSIHNKLSQAAGYLINSQVQRREFEADERAVAKAEA